MSWSVTFQGSSTQINTSFDLAAEQLRLANPPIGEFEDLHQARTLILAALETYGCQLSGTAHGYWVGVEFHSFRLSMQRYVPPSEVQLQLPEQPVELYALVEPACQAVVPGFGVTCGCPEDDWIHRMAGSKVHEDGDMGHAFVG